MTDTQGAKAVAIPIRRGCGTRKRGGIYLEYGLGMGGTPVEETLLDPPLDVADLGVPARGVLPVEIGGVTHLVDHVGSAFYPNVADFIEEARRAGVSRRLPQSLDYSALTEHSQLILTHEKAIILNAAALGLPRRCPCGHAEHEEAGWEQTCAWHWWHDVAGGRPLTKDEIHRITDLFPAYIRTTGRWAWVERELPALRYWAHAWTGEQAPIYREGAFMHVRATRLVVIRDPEEGRHEAALAKASRAGLSVEVVDE